VDESQTHATTTAPGRVTRVISRTPPDAVGHQLYYELGQYHVELADRERQLLADPDAHVGSGDARPAGLDESLGGVDRGDVLRPEPVREHDRQRSGSAADVERALPPPDARHLCQPGRELRAIPADVAVVGLRLQPGKAHTRRLGGVWRAADHLAPNRHP
jgi:hypothetical protein